MVVARNLGFANNIISGIVTTAFKDLRSSMDSLLSGEPMGTNRAFIV